jgi:hypothetical protein
MKKLVVLFIALAFFATVSLISCGPSQEPPKPAPPKEEAKPAPAPEKPAEKPAEAPAPAKK